MSNVHSPTSFVSVLQHFSKIGLILFVFSFVGGLVGLLINSILPTSYQVRSIVENGLGFAFSEKRCAFVKPRGDSVGSACLSEDQLYVVRSVLGPEWKMNFRGEVYLVTGSPAEAEVYDAKLDEVARAVTIELAQAAKLDASVLSKMASSGLTSFVVDSDLLDAQRVLSMIDSGKLAVVFDDVTIEKVSPKTPLIILAGLVFGAIIGFGFIILRKNPAGQNAV